MAYVTGDPEWDVLEISLADRTVHNLIVGGGVAWWPDWHPSGTHFAFSTNRDGTYTVVDKSSKEGFMRQLAEAPSEGVVNAPLWAPDGTRFLFYAGTSPGGKLVLSDASGGRMIALDATAILGLASWSPMANGSPTYASTTLPKWSKFGPDRQKPQWFWAAPSFRAHFPPVFL